MVKENPNYTDAFQELQTIVQKMEDANISVDELTQNIERATFLINICKNKLSKTEEEVNKIIEKNND
ncbi:MAG TPA: exodeoxyribonuclease VII small subunit [Bacteroidales bacterium]|nr:exodeoxyribonuclease VII small subunit [Bacteroidales bacterium]HPT52259.1 exodeoxyribonuclease VII small subunit [Bacteroidales bacterium]